MQTTLRNCYNPTIRGDGHSYRNCCNPTNRGGHSYRSLVLGSKLGLELGSKLGLVLGSKRLELGSKLGLVLGSKQLVLGSKLQRWCRSHYGQLSAWPIVRRCADGSLCRSSRRRGRLKTVRHCYRRTCGQRSSLVS
ncbi:MAG: hypothetical protein R3C09_21580 [Pirellulaceae bacterium]